jgi:hypothetical protein
VNASVAQVRTADSMLPEGDPRSQANIERRKTLKLAERDELGPVATRQRA